MRTIQIAQNLIDRVKATEQKVSTHDSVKLELAQEVPFLVETREVVRNFPMPLVFDGKCVGTKEIEGDDGHKETVEELIFEGKLYMGDTCDIYQIVEGQIVEFVVSSPVLEKAIIDFITATYGE